LVGESVQSRGTAPYLLNLMSPNTPHVLIASTTGGGKTNLLLDMILSLANLNDARRLSIVALDPKGIDLHCLNGLPHLAGPVVRDAVDCVPVLQSVVDEMDRRKRVGKEPTHRIVVAIDEVADLMDVAGDEVAYQIKRIMQLGRGLGIHVIAATQKPSAEQVGSIIKANFPVRIVGAVASTTDATVAAGFGGTSAERLPGRGSFLIVKGGDVQSLQAYYADKGETAQRCGLSGKQNATFHPAWRYAKKESRSVRSEPVHTGAHTGANVYAYTADIPESIPLSASLKTTDLLPFEPLDKYGAHLVRGLYHRLGSKNKVINSVWPGRYKNKCLEYINTALEVTQ
jgi:DNA segregation ATPase FtsK/SpoIIIE-like protein